LSIHRFKSEGFYQIFPFVRQNVQEKKLNRIALTNKFSIIAAHHCLYPIRMFLPPADTALSPHLLKKMLLVLHAMYHPNSLALTAARLEKAGEICKSKVFNPNQCIFARYRFYDSNSW
jgi:hypothetical protein